LRTFSFFFALIVLQLFTFSRVIAQEQDSITIDISIADSIDTISKTVDAPPAMSVDFVRYLIANELYSDAILAMDSIEQLGQFSSENQRDSLDYLRGWVCYFNSDLSNAIVAFDEVRPSALCYSAALFYKAFCQSYIGQNDVAMATLSQFEGAVHDTSLLQFTKASISLLYRDYESFDQYSAHFDGSNYAFAAEEVELIQLRDSLLAYRQKSAFLAALLSSVVPGLGKFYVGYRGIPLGATLMVMPLAAVAVETFILAGPISVPFIAAAGVFGVFYVGNIWGSALSAKAHRIEYEDEIDENIMLNLHIALRRSFE